MSVIILSGIDFSNLFSSESIIGVMTPVSSYGSLNAVIAIKEAHLELYFRDTSSVVKVTCPVGKVEDYVESYRYIDYNKLIYTLHQYDDTQLMSLSIELTTEGEHSQFRIICGKDSISLPNYLALNTVVMDMVKVLSKDVDESICFQTNTVDGKYDCLQLYSTISNALPFISKDEAKNNAGALYPNAFIVNDRRHIFIQKDHLYDGAATFIPLHKKNMNIYLKSLDSEKDYKMDIFSKNEFIHIEKQGFEGMFMNSMSNIVPPAEKDLEKIQSTHKVTTIKAGELYDIISFFSGYYTSASSDFRPIGIETKKGEQELKFFVRDSGISGFGACAIEKSILVTEAFDMDISTQVVFDSFKLFLSKEMRDQDIKIYLDNEKPALKLVGNSTIYLSKIVG